MPNPTEEMIEAGYRAFVACKPITSTDCEREAVEAIYLAMSRLDPERERLHGMLQTVTDLLARYRKETPSGHSPHMICHLADDAITQARALLNSEVSHGRE